MNFTPTEKDIERANKRMSDPQENAMFNRIKDPVKLLTRAMAFASHRNNQYDASKYGRIVTSRARELGISKDVVDHFVSECAHIQKAYYDASRAADEAKARSIVDTIPAGLARFIPTFGVKGSAKIGGITRRGTLYFTINGNNIDFHYTYRAGRHSSQRVATLGWVGSGFKRDRAERFKNIVVSHQIKVFEEVQNYLP